MQFVGFVHAILVQDLDLVQERARLLQEEIVARVGEATHHHLFVLSIYFVMGASS